MCMFEVPLEELREHLLVSDGFWETWEERRKDCNGCGTGWNRYIVPDSVYGLNIRIVCCVHDFDYEIGGTEEDKKRFDENLHDNIEMIIDLYDRWYYPTRLANRRADTYRFAVNHAGNSSFNFKG